MTMENVNIDEDIIGYVKEEDISSDIEEDIGLEEEKEEVE